MSDKVIKCDYGLIGDDLDLKENIEIKINKDGRISQLSFTTPENKIKIGKSQTVLMIPSLINSHIHIGDSFAKEKGYNKNLSEVVAPPDGIKHKLLRETPLDVKIQGILKTVEDLLHNGITCFIDFRERGLEGINLLKKVLLNFPIDYLLLGRFKDKEQACSVYNLADGIGLVTYKQVTTSIYEELKKCKERGKKKIACHCAEKIREESLIKKIIDEGLVDILVHGTQFIEEDLEKIRDHDLSLVICPRCNGYFGVGFPPISTILKLKMQISIGTDNIMANSPDLFEEVRYLYRISRVIDNQQLIEAKSLLKMITINAAKNFELDNDIGSIKKGKYANFITINLNDPNFYVYPLEIQDIYRLIVQRTKSSNILKTFYRGKAVFERN
ncbi:MAG: amidohydrolase family protein [Promethearchaeota archaeon]